jgi:hypothetical protein
MEQCHTLQLCWRQTSVGETYWTLYGVQETGQMVLLDAWLTQGAGRRLEAAQRLLRNVTRHAVTPRV